MRLSWVHYASVLHTDTKYIESENSNYDWGLLEFSSDIGSSTGYFGASWTTSSLVGTGIVVRGYPVEKNAQMWSMSGSIAASGTWKGHEVLIATHIDKGHIHTHFIVNSVNYEDGHKLQWSKYDLKDLKERCNEQSREQGLHVPEKGKTFAGEVREETVAWSKDTYQLLKQAEQGKVRSYVQDIALAVLDCKETATSRETFIRLMNERGYGVDWQDSHKYITYTDLAREQAGEKACKIRDNKLEKYYNMDFGKESMEHEFERNARTAEAEQSKRAASRVKPTEPDRAGKQSAQRSVGDVERELRGIDEAVKSRTSKGRAEQAERRRAEQEAHQRAEAERRATEEQQRIASRRYIGRGWEFER